MKKLFLTGALALFAAVNAQEYKAGAGDVTVDFGLSGGLGNTAVSLPAAGLDAGAVFKARYFNSEQWAYRGILNVNSTSTTDKSASVPNVSDNKQTKSNLGLELGLGLERHFTGTDRLDTYVGGDILVGFNSQKVTTEVNSLTNTDKSKNEVKGPNAFNFGVRGVFGADYYFAKRVYLGVEGGLAVKFGSRGETKTSSSATVGGVTTNTESSTKGGSSFGITPSVVAGIRLGYAF